MRCSRPRSGMKVSLPAPWTSYMGVELHPSLAAKAAALLAGLSRNHPFVDGNKRTTIGAVSVFLLANGYRLVFGNDEEVANFGEITAQGSVHHEFVSAWIAAHLDALPTGTP
ncbi:type II toxin-antitoxin system death-on-curing family toxin [Kocuria rhizophila]|nr:death-on-curing family protein [Kocuria rhizophila]